jgi:SAM-dependent methyltransferase
MKGSDIKRAVRQGYARLAKKEGACCPPGSAVCGPAVPAAELGRRVGYTEDELRAVPEGANMGLGCGNPVALAALREGETVLDLGSGAGFDCFLAARRVGATGQVFGLDMTAEMVEKARRNAEKGGYDNVAFKLGEMESIPLPADAVDAVISNCVINLSPDKRAVFEEAYRVLKPGGRLMISDIVVTKPLPGFIRESVEAYIGCLSGAMVRDDYLACIAAAGFQDIEVVDETPFPFDCLVNDPLAKAVIEKERLSIDAAKQIAATITSLKVQARKGPRKGDGH